MYLPTEPLLAGLLLLYMIKYLMGDRIDIKVLRHPVTIAIYFHLAWMFLTSLTSSDVLVSFKAFATRLWFIVSFYLIATQLFRKEKNMQTYPLGFYRGIYRCDYLYPDQPFSVWF